MQTRPKHYVPQERLRFEFRWKVWYWGIYKNICPINKLTDEEKALLKKGEMTKIYEILHNINCKA